MTSVKAAKALGYNIYLFIYLLVLYILDDEGTERRHDHTHVEMQRKKPELVVADSKKEI